MSYKNLKDILLDLDDYDFEESSSKLELNFHDIEDKDERTTKYANAILENAKALVKPYGKDTLKYLYDICTNDGVIFDMDYNTLICDGLCYTEKNNGKEFIKTTDDFKEAFTKAYNDSDMQNKIDSYDETERVISGIIKTYGAITSDDIYEIFIDVKTSAEDEFNDEDEFDMFLYHRDNIMNHFPIYEYEDEEYFIIDELQDPDEVIDDIINSDKARRVLSRNDYLTFAVGDDFVTDEKALKEFKALINNLTNDSDEETEDIVNTVMYDIKMGNLDDLMLDIMTYVDIASDEEHEEIKNKLSDLYEKTPTWFGEYLVKNN
ncbi:MAG: hypothetical protein MJ245_03930 [Clostridia bacterium]|nr:hypothetical protein [Clostridia bacterium]